MQIVELINSYVWGLPLIFMILFIGIYFTVDLNFIQFRCFLKAFKLMFKHNEKDVGTVSSFGALCSSLAATIGTGSIVGVATAIAAGGIGTIFWMTIAAIIGMALKYAECLLGVYFRKKNILGETVGGPFYYILNGLGKRFKPLAYLFAVSGSIAALIGIGTMVQANSIKEAAIILINRGDLLIIKILIGIVITALAGIIIIGGIKRIAFFAQMFIPFFTIIYVIACLYIISINFDKLPYAVNNIIKSAFSLKSSVAGFTGFGFILAMRYGIARGIFSNEAGLGSEPITAATARTDFAAKQGLISMIGVFIDTIVICNLTGIVIVITGIDYYNLENGVSVVCDAFNKGIFKYFNGDIIVLWGIIFFAFTSIIGWSYYGEKCFLFLTKEKHLLLYRMLYLIFIFVGTIFTSKFIWGIADIFNGIMAFPNLISVILLSKIVKKQTILFRNSDKIIDNLKHYRV